VTCFDRANIYEFKINGKRIVFKPAKPKSSMGSHKTGIITDKESNKSLHLMIISQFLKEGKNEGIVYVIVSLGEFSSAPVGFSSEVRHILTDFSDIMPNELPDELPPLRNIRHVIDFMPESNLLNLPHYRMNPTEQAKLKRHVDELKALLERV